jgi:ABC-type glycerol-3-phosphate transport system substrate-binding protein
MSVRTFWCTVVCCIAVGAVAWNGGGARAEQVTIKVWMHEHPPRIPIDKRIVAEFEKAYPGIKVDYQVIGASEYATKLLAAFAAGAGPDVFNRPSRSSHNTTTPISSRLSIMRRWAMPTRTR